MVIDRLLLGFRNHAANSITTGALFLLVDPSTYSVWNLFLHDLALISHTWNFARLDFRNPNTLADLARRALILHYSATARDEDPSAGTRVTRPTTWVAYDACTYWPRAFDDLGFKMTGPSLNGLRVMNRL